MNYYKKTEEFYSNHYTTFSVLENRFSQKLEIPNDILRDTIKSYLVSVFNKSCSSYEKIRKTGTFVESLKLYYGFLIYIFFKSTSKSNNNDIKGKVVLDIWYEGAESFYSKFISKQEHYNINTYNEKNKDIYSRNFTSIYNYKFRTPLVITLIKEIGLSFFLLYKASKKININLIYIFISIYKHILSYETDLNGLTDNILISGHDNGFNALKYYYYKKHFKKIHLVQNGGRVGYSSCYFGNSYVYADSYSCYGKKTTLPLTGWKINKTLPVGSLRLSSYIKLLNRYKVTYDVLFVEQIGPGDAFDFVSYLNAVKLLCKFAKKHKQYNITYKPRIHRSKLHKFDKFKQDYIQNIDKLLSRANIKIGLVEDDSYIEVIKSDVVCFYSSSLGFEALGLKKKVLNLNLNKYSHGLSLKNEMGVLVDNNYYLFEKKLAYLLNKKNLFYTNRYFKKQREFFMNYSNKSIYTITSEITNV